MATAHEVDYRIVGDDMQAVILTLGQGDAVRAEAGAMMYMTEGIEMDAKMAAGYFTEGISQSQQVPRRFIMGNLRVLAPAATLDTVLEIAGINMHWMGQCGIFQSDSYGGTSYNSRRFRDAVRLRIP